MSEQTIPCLSILQPWASAIACGAKRIETRSWQTHYRGPLLIHAGKNTNTKLWPNLRGDLNGQEVWLGVAERTGFDFSTGLPRTVNLNNWMHRLPLGAIIAVAELVGCIETERLGRDEDVWCVKCNETYHWFDVTERELALGDYTPGRYGWVLANVQPLAETVYYKGRQRLFRVPLDAVRHALPADWSAKLEVRE